MKKKIKFLIYTIIVIILIIICFLLIKKSKFDDDYSILIKYIKNIYGEAHLIPEFDNINNADEEWLWNNINQYLWNIPENEERNNKYCDYSYEEISQIAKTLYGNNLNKSVPTGNNFMLYDDYNNKYGPPAYNLEEYYAYKIENIEKNKNIFNVTIIDYTISMYNTLGNNPTNTIDIFNINDFKLNSYNATPIVSLNTLNTDYSDKILNNKNKLSRKLLTIELDKKTHEYHIKSCKYLDIKSEDILANTYKNMQNTFEILYINYDYEDLYDNNEAEVKNFNELASIYTENALPIYKEQMELFMFKEDKIYIQPGDINIAEYLEHIKFNNIKKSSNSISCTVVRTFRKGFSPDDEDYNETYEVSNEFSIIKDGDNWKVDKFSYTF